MLYLLVLDFVVVLIDGSWRVLSCVAGLGELAHEDLLLVVSLGLREPEDGLRVLVRERQLAEGSPRLLGVESHRKGGQSYEANMTASGGLPAKVSGLVFFSCYCSSAMDLKF